MKIFHIADIHIDLIATRLGKFKLVDGVNAIYIERLERFKKLITWGIEDAKCDMVVIAGDLFNRPKPFPQELWDVANILDNIPTHIPVYVIPGNHDEPTARGCALQPLQNRRPNVNVYLTPHVVVAGGLATPICIAPWGTPLDQIAELRRHHFDGRMHDPILLTHLSTTLEGQHWTEVAGEVGTIPLQNLRDLKFAAVLMGHYHGQTDLGQNIWFPGSPECFNFGEAAQSKGVLVWHISDDGTVNCQPITVPGGPVFKTFTVQEFLDYNSDTFNGYVRVQGEANEQEKALVVNKLQNFQCEDYKLDLQSTAKLTKTFSLKGQSNKEIITNYLLSKNIPASEALLELDQDIEGEVL